MKKFPHELIGKQIEVVDAANKSYIGLHGTIIRETKMTLTITDPAKPGATVIGPANTKKVIMKNEVLLKIIGNGLVQGKNIVGKPEERIKWAM